MLEPAIKYKNQLESLQYNIWFNDKYKYWSYHSYCHSIPIAENTWDTHQFVSVYNGVVIGYISYEISREKNSAYDLNIINFSDNKVVFGKDLGQALKDIFERYKFRKLNFSVLIGNPIEKSYDKMINQYGGRIVGTCKEEVKLIDGEYYDKKLYEILAREYFKATSNTSK